MEFSLRILEECDSTNEELARLPPEEWAGKAIMTLRQREGKGRRGRSWLQGEGSLALSLGLFVPESELWRVPLVPFAFSISVFGVLEDRCRELGLDGKSLRLKWPNDLYLYQRKLGGILGQSRSLASGGVSFVLGLGLNLKPLPPGALDNSYGSASWSETGDSWEALALAEKVIERYPRDFSSVQGPEPILDQWWRASRILPSEGWLAESEEGLSVPVRPIRLLPNGALLVFEEGDTNPKELWAHEISLRGWR